MKKILSNKYFSYAALGLAAFALWMVYDSYREKKAVNNAKNKQLSDADSGSNSGTSQVMQNLSNGLVDRNGQSFNYV